MLDKVTELLLHGQLKFNQGEIQLLGQSVGMVPIDYLVTVQKNLEKNNVENVLYSNSKEMGIRWFKNMYDHFKIKPQDVTRWGVNILSVAGWGETLVVDFDMQKEMMKVNIRNSAQAKAYGKSDHPVDSFVRGCYASGAQVLFGKECDAVEIRCMSQGFDFCEFVAQPTEKFDLNNPVVKKQLVFPQH